jgi:hypothetical protein
MRFGEQPIAVRVKSEGATPFNGHWYLPTTLAD